MHGIFTQGWRDGCMLSWAGTACPLHSACRVEANAMHASECQVEAACKPCSLNIRRWGRTMHPRASPQPQPSPVEEARAAATRSASCTRALAATGTHASATSTCSRPGVGGEEGAVGGQAPESRARAWPAYQPACHKLEHGRGAAELACAQHPPCGSQTWTACAGCGQQQFANNHCTTALAQHPPCG